MRAFSIVLLTVNAQTKVVYTHVCGYKTSFEVVVRGGGATGSDRIFCTTIIVVVPLRMTDRATGNDVTHPQPEVGGCSPPFSRVFRK